jgi:gliding motility-associated-like protein
MINGITPHSGNNMLMIDNILASNATAWEQTISVEANRVYYFSAWLTALSPRQKSEMIFQVEAGGITQQLGEFFIPPDGPQWQQYFGVWNSATNTTATIRLVNTNPQAVGGDGNDYAIDDIEFKPSCVGVDAGPRPQFLDDTLSVCNWGGVVDLNSSQPNHPDHTFTWFYNGAEVDTNTIDPQILSNQVQIGTYVVCLDSSGCVQADTVELISELFVDLGEDESLCSPSYKFLNTNIFATENFTINWYRDGVLIDSIHEPSFLANGAGTYSVEILDDLGGSCNGSDEIVISSELPEPTSATICPESGETSATLSVAGNGTYEWYSEEIGGAVIGTGSTITINNISSDTVFYVQDTTWWNSSAGVKNLENLTGINAGQNNVHDQNFLRFNARGNSIIDSVTVPLNFFGPAGGDLEARLRNVTDGTTSFKTMSITSPGVMVDTVVFPLEIPIEDGKIYELSIVGVSGNFRAFRYDGTAIGALYPALYERVEFLGGQAPTVMPGLFDWKISYAPPCDRVPAQVIVECACEDPENLTLNVVGDTLLCEGESFNEKLQARVTNPSVANWEYAFRRNGASLTFSTDSNFTVTQEGVYSVTVRDPSSSECESTSRTISFNFETRESAEAGDSITACSANPEVELSGVVSGGSGEWFGNGTFDPSVNDLSASYTPTNTELSSGEAQLILQASDGDVCSGGRDTLIISYVSVISADAGDDQDICYSGAPISLSGTSSTGSGQWSGGSGTFGDASALNTTYTPTEAEITSGSVTLTLNVDAIGTCAPASDEIAIQMERTPTVDLGNDTSICSSETSISLEAELENGASGTWTGAGTFTPSITSLTPDYEPTSAERSAGVFTLEFKADDGAICTGETDEITVTLDNVPTADAGDDITVCEDDPEIFLSGVLDDASSAIWSGGNGIFDNPNRLSVQYTLSQTDIAVGNISIRLTPQKINSCTPVSDVVNITIDQSPEVFISAPDTVCASDNSVSLLATINNTPGGMWYGSGTFSPDNQSNSIFYTFSAAERSSGFSVVEYETEVNGACDAVREPHTIFIVPERTPSITIDTLSEMCVNEAIEFGLSSEQNVGNAPVYQWQVDGSVVGQGTRFSSTDLESGQIVQVKLLTSGTCFTAGPYLSNEIEVDLRDCTCPEFTVPDVITPNNDGKNDVWEVNIPKCYTNHTVRVFNRYGNEVFSSLDYHEGSYWDGARNGKGLPMAVYYYVIEYLPEGEDLKTKKGSVSIVK